MDDGQIVYSKRRKHDRVVKELVARGSYSVIIIVVALIALRPLMVKQLLNRADAFSAFGLYDESKRQCDKALLLDSDNSQAWYNLARIYQTQNELDLALGAYLRATETDPANVPAQFELGKMYLLEGRHQQAIPHFDQVRRHSLENGPRSPKEGEFPYHRSSLDMLLECYEKVKDTAKAEFTREELRVYYPHYTPSESDTGETGERSNQ